MALRYRVYSNGGSGPIDYSTPLQDSPSTVFSYATLPPGDWLFGVRTYDDVSGIEEKNTDAVLGVAIGADFLDRSAVPNSPIGLTARATAGGGLKIDFMYVGTGQRGAPTEYRAWIWAAGSVDWTLPPSAVLATTFGPGDVRSRHSMTLSGLSDGAAYAVGIRAAGAAGDDGNTATVIVIGKASGPLAVGGLAASAGYPSGV